MEMLGADGPSTMNDRQHSKLSNLAKNWAANRIIHIKFLPNRLKFYSSDSLLIQPLYGLCLLYTSRCV